MNDRPTMPDKDHPLGGPKRKTAGPLVLTLLIVAGIVAVILALTYFVSSEREAPRREGAGLGVPTVGARA